MPCHDPGGGLVDLALQHPFGPLHYRLSVLVPEGRKTKSNDHFERAEAGGDRDSPRCGFGHRFAGGADRDSDGADQRVDRAHADAPEGLRIATRSVGARQSSTAAVGLRPRRRPAAVSRYYRQAGDSKVTPVGSRFPAVVRLASHRVRRNNVPGAVSSGWGVPGRSGGIRIGARPKFSADRRGSSLDGPGNLFHESLLVDKLSRTEPRFAPPVGPTGGRLRGGSWVTRPALSRGPARRGSALGSLSGFGISRRARGVRRSRSGAVAPAWRDVDRSAAFRDVSGIQIEFGKC